MKHSGHEPLVVYTPLDHLVVEGVLQPRYRLGVTGGR